MPLPFASRSNSNPYWKVIEEGKPKHSIKKYGTFSLFT